MAQQDDTRRTTTSNAPRPQNSPGSKSQTSPNGGGSSWAPKSSSKEKQNHDQNEHGTHHHKKSVFTKVKEKARKLKKSISGRKRRDENETQSPYITPPGSAGSLDDDDKDQPEFFVYEPHVAPNTNKHSDNNGSSRKPDLNVDANQSGLTISTCEETETARPGNSVEEKDSIKSSMHDKGVSVKEYIMNKFEPGEDERALSQAITQTISPKCEKVKEAMNSLLGNEEASESIRKSSNVELDVTPSGTSTESNDKKLTLLTDDPNLGSSLHTSNLKPNSG